MYTSKKNPDGSFDLYKNGTVCRCPMIHPIMMRNQVTGAPVPAFMPCTSSCALAEIDETTETYKIMCGAQIREIKLDAIEVPNDKLTTSKLVVS